MKKINGQRYITGQKKLEKKTTTKREYQLRIPIRLAVILFHSSQKYFRFLCIHFYDPKFQYLKTHHSVQFTTINHQCTLLKRTTHVPQLLADFQNLSQVTFSWFAYLLWHSHHSLWSHHRKLIGCGFDAFDDW